LEGARNELRIKLQMMSWRLATAMPFRESYALRLPAEQAMRDAIGNRSLSPTRTAEPGPLPRKRDAATQTARPRPPRAPRNVVLPQPRMIYLVRRLQVSSYLQLEESLQRFDITPTQYTVMSTLAHRERLSSAQLSRRFFVKPQSMIKLIASLEAKNLISRVAANGDRRVLEVSLTPAGRRMLTACEIAVDDLEKRMFEKFSAPQLAQFRRFMQKAVDENR
jgi:DNA-binding MarR family transcriptional regulator